MLFLFLPNLKLWAKGYIFRTLTIFIMTKYNFSARKLIFRQNVVLLQSNN